MEPPAGTKIAQESPFVGPYRFAAPCPSYFHDSLAWGSKTETDKQAEMFRQVSGGSSLVEVGSNIGVYAAHAHPHFSRIYGFECAALYYECLRFNIGLNNLTNVEARHVYVMDYDSPPQFAKLDTLLPDVTDCGMICIDTDGNDMHVLNGAREFIRRQKRRPFIQFEFVPRGWINVGHSSIVELIAFLEAFDYWPYIVAGNGWGALSRSILTELWRCWGPGSDAWQDVFLSPRGSTYGILPPHPDW